MRTLGIEEQVIQIHRKRGTWKKAWNPVKANSKIRQLQFCVCESRKSSLAFHEDSVQLLLGFGIENVVLSHHPRLILLELDSPGYWCPLERDVYFIIFIFNFLKEECWS